MAKAYVGLTHPDWLQHFASHPEPVVDFWRPNVRSFKAINAGSRFFCLERGSPHHRRVFGAMGNLQEYKVLTVRDAWEQYGSTLGASSLMNVLGRLEDYDSADQPIGNIILDHFQVAETAITSGLFEQETGVEGVRYWQSGAVITEADANWLEYAMFGGANAAAGAIGPIVDRVIGNEEPERREIIRELVYRDRAVIDQAKREQGTRCRICGFCFSKTYGPHGEGFIEVHHWPMLSAGGPDTTRNVFVVCANCHRMLHRSRAGLEWHELKKIVDSNRGTD